MVNLLKNKIYRYKIFVNNIVKMQSSLLLSVTYCTKTLKHKVVY